MSAKVDRESGDYVGTVAGRILRLIYDKGEVNRTQIHNRLSGRVPVHIVQKAIWLLLAHGLVRMRVGDPPIGRPPEIYFR